MTRLPNELILEIYSYLDFEKLAELDNVLALKAFDEKTHTWEKYSREELG